MIFSVLSRTHRDAGLFKAVSAGTYHKCGILTNGSVVCWGSNTKGRLGVNRTTTFSSDTPVAPLLRLSPGSCIGLHTADQSYLLVVLNELFPSMAKTDEAGASVSSISSGYDHTCVILTDGTVMCWGENSCGQLGIGNRDVQDLPVTVDLGSGVFSRSTQEMCSQESRGGWGCCCSNAEKAARNRLSGINANSFNGPIMIRHTYTFTASLGSELHDSCQSLCQWRQDIFVCCITSLQQHCIFIAAASLLHRYCAAVKMRR
jgi:hypothetical protein